MSNKFVQPRIKGTELFPNVSKTPPTMIISGPAAGTPEGQELVNRYMGEINAFQLQMNNQHALSGQNTVSIRRNLGPGIYVVYENQFDKEYVRVFVEGKTPYKSKPTYVILLATTIPEMYLGGVYPATEFFVSLWKDLKEKKTKIYFVEEFMEPALYEDINNIDIVYWYENLDGYLNLSSGLPRESPAIVAALAELGLKYEVCSVTDIEMGVIDGYLVFPPFYITDYYTYSVSGYRAEFSQTRAEAIKKVALKHGAFFFGRGVIQWNDNHAIASIFGKQEWTPKPWFFDLDPNDPGYAGVSPDDAAPWTVLGDLYTTGIGAKKDILLNMTAMPIGDPVTMSSYRFTDVPDENVVVRAAVDGSPVGVALAITYPPETELIPGEDLSYYYRSKSKNE